MMAPILERIATASALGQSMPEDVASEGLTFDDFKPARYAGGLVAQKR